MAVNAAVIRQVLMKSLMFIVCGSIFGGLGQANWVWDWKTAGVKTALMGQKDRWPAS